MVVVAILAWVALVFVPGGVLLAALRSRASIASVVAAAPVVSLGIIASWAVALDKAHVHYDPLTVLPVLIGVVILAVAWARWRPGERPRRPLTRWGRAQTWTVVAISLASTALWLWASHGATAVPANDDGSNHGWFTARIVALHTANPALVTNGDAYSTTPAASYYPLALHLASALVSEVTHADVGMALVVALAVTAGVSLPLGMAVLAGRLFPGRVWAGPAAALLAVTFPAYPYYPSYWGGLPLILGMALVAPTVDLVLGVVEEPKVWRSGLLAALGLLGLFSLHNSEVVTVAGLVALVMIGETARRRWPYVRAAVPRLAVAGGLALVVVVPQLHLLGVGASQREGVAVLHPVGVADATGKSVLTFFGPSTLLGQYAPAILGDRSTLQLTAAWTGLLVLAALVVLGMWRTRRTRPEWSLGFVALLAITAMSALSLPGMDLITLPWYSRWDRVVLNQLYFIATLGGVGAAAMGAALVRRRRQATALATLALVAVPAVPQLVDSVRTVQFAFDSASLATPAARGAFAYLRDHVKPGDRVLNDEVDGSVWMYALDGVAPLTTAKHADLPSDGSVSYLQSHAAYLTFDPQALAAADEWHVTYAYVGPDVMPFRTSSLDAAALEQSWAWRLVYDVGGARVFQRVMP